ncbi:MAG: sigma-70 family RNA polymerase sigma factor [Acidobacteria bacterium]|nr:sigma-70 family RNA polymerase sigma factor [Acidobacteriota bacterium]
MPSDAYREHLAGFIRSERAGSALQEQVAQLFEEMREDVYRYLLTLGLYPPQAQEATQEVFLRLYVTMKKNEEEIRSPKAWVYRVAHNYGLKVRAKQNHEPPYDPEVEVKLRSNEASPEQSLLEREKTIRFHRAIEGLSEQQKRCLFLRLEGLRYPEIGQSLGISASAVGEFLRRAVVRLKKVTHE